MSESENNRDENVSASEEKPKQVSLPARLRIWPAVVIVAAYAITLAVTLYLPTIIGNAIGIVGLPFLSTLLLALWWLTLSRTPWRDRLIGLIVFAAIAGWIVATQQRDKSQILLIALPVMNIGVVLILAATVRSAWPAQRVKALLFLIGCAILFPMFRIEDIASNLAPILTWRWSATSEELLEQSMVAGNPGGKADVPAQAGPLDWPGFRGPGRDGIVRGVAIATNWNEKPPKELWRRRVGLGFSSFVAVGNYIFTQEQRRQDEIVVCYRADNGEEVWVNATKARFDNSTGSGPRATPTFDNGKIYAQGATGTLQCLEATTGAVVWKADVAADTGAKLPQWGFASSPLVTDKLVIVFTGGAGNKAVIAYDKVTGTKTWCGGAGTNGYSSAHLARIDGAPQVVVLSDFGVQSLEPETGAVLWQNEWKTSMNTRVVQPTVVDGRAVLVGTAEGKGTRSLLIARSDAGWTAQEKWTTREFRPYFNDYVLYRGYCYGFDGNMLACIDANTGKRRWKGSHYGGQVLLIENSEVLIVLTEKGELALVRATPNEFEEIAKIPAIKGKTWNHPIVANGKLFVRNAEEAACYELPT